MNRANENGAEELNSCHNIRRSSRAKVHVPGALLSSCPYFQHNQFLRFQYTGQENVGDLRVETGVIAGKES